MSEFLDNFNPKPKRKYKFKSTKSRKEAIQKRKETRERHISEYIDANVVLGSGEVDYEDEEFV